MVTLGGGHGLHVMLSALVRLDVDITAIVTVADDGGSSGRLRLEVPGIVPPGDLRMALTALSRPDDAGQLWSETFQHRFRGEGALAGHPVGNIVLVGLTQVLGDPVAALDAAGTILGARGRVLPMACEPLDIVADVEGLDEDPTAVRRIRGQVAVATTPGRVRSVTLAPPDARACPEALDAIAAADLLTFGPGSWFTSVLPHLLLPEMADAIKASSRPPAGRAEPGRADRRDRRVLPGAAPGRTLSTRPRPPGRFRAGGPGLGGPAAATGIGRITAGSSAGSGRRRRPRDGAA